ncbi:hypothetical protein BGZ57DRAFT_934907 [Hyaloscypha finlandica]|nr:hypothetical protein BGZ57DRAFT_934907 [Hyaloscypha finlandica]
MSEFFSGAATSHEPKFTSSTTVVLLICLAAPASAWGWTRTLPPDTIVGYGANTTNQTLAIDMPPVNTSLFTTEAYAGVKELANERRNLTQPELTRRAPFLPVSVNWQNRFGIHWLATIQDQNPCNNCWAFATAALLETQVRIEHGYWSKRSEGDIRDRMLDGHEPGLPGKVTPNTQYCGQSATLGHALRFATESGAADPGCFSFSTRVPDPYTPCADRDGRITKVGAYHDIGTRQDQKSWLYHLGPTVITFDAVNAFKGYSGGVFHAPTSGNGAVVAGQHTLLVVGYNDNLQAWRIRNSWGTAWGEGGYGWLGYGEMDSDSGGMQGFLYTDPDPWVKRRLHNGNLIHSNSGAFFKNFELVVCGPSAVHYRWRSDDNTFTWFSGPNLLEFSVDHPSQCNGHPSITSTTYNRNVEVLYWSDSNNVVHLYFDQSLLHWFVGGSFGNGQIGGYPGFIQGNYGAPGNFEVVVRHTDGSLRHWWRPDRSRTWNYGGLVCAGGVRMSGPSLIQANVGSTGNFYVVAVMEDTSLKLFWRNNDDPSLPWLPGETFGGLAGWTGATMIQPSFNTQDEYDIGDFEVLVAVFGTAVRYRRDNSDLRAGGTPRDQAGDETRWKQVDTFGAPRVKHVWSFMQGPFYGNLEAVIEKFDGTMQHWFHDENGWNYGADIPPAG